MYSESARPFLIAENRRYANIVKTAHKRTKSALHVAQIAALLSCVMLTFIANYPDNIWFTVGAAITVGTTLSNVWTALSQTFKADYYHGLHMQKAAMLYSTEAEYARITNRVFMAGPATTNEET